MLARLGMRGRPHGRRGDRRRLLRYAGWGATVGLLGWFAVWTIWSGPSAPDRSVAPSVYLREPALPVVTPGIDGSLAPSGTGLGIEESEAAPAVPPQAPPLEPATVSDGVPAAVTAGGVVPPETAAPAGQVPPMAVPETADPAPGPPLVVQAILTARDRRLAVVDERVVGPGDTLGGYVVIEVQEDGVLLEDERGGTRRLPLER